MPVGDGAIVQSAQLQSHFILIADSLLACASSLALGIHSIGDQRHVVCWGTPQFIARGRRHSELFTVSVALHSSS